MSWEIEVHSVNNFTPNHHNQFKVIETFINFYISFCHKPLLMRYITHLYIEYLILQHRLSFINNPASTIY